MRNPFGFSDVKLGPATNDYPLLTWKWSVPAEEYHVFVDDTETAFNKFTAIFSDIFHDGQKKISPGHLVTVLGETGYGKTSLASRCVHWLSDECLKPKNVPLEIVDMHNEQLVGDTLDKRLSKVYQHVLMKLRSRLNLGDQRYQDMRSYADDDYSLAYRELSELLDGICIAVILLPRTTITGELPLYHNLASNRENIIFFAEGGNAEVCRECRQLLPEGPAHTSLTVGPLKLDDAWQFTQARMNRHNDQKPELIATREELNAMLREIPALRSIRTLQCFFFRLFDDAIKNDRNQITYADIEKFWKKNSDYVDVSR